MEKQGLIKWDEISSAIELAKDIQELNSIGDRLEAFRLMAKQLKQSLEVQNRIAEYRLRVDRKRGEWIGENIKQGGDRKSKLIDTTLIATLESIGISKDNSVKLQAIANLPEADFEKHIQAVRESNEELTSVGMIRLARKLQPQITPPPPPEGKYQVIYADPPWAYDVDLSEGATRSPTNNYPVMDLETLKIFGEKVKEISHKDCILFMWITAPKLNWMNDVLEAWGFDYKTNLIWDKIKPNMGHYSSVRHEILIIAGKGTCSPTCDGKTIQSVDSVQSIEKSARHSEKPLEFIDIIEKLYPDYKKIELFARNKEGRKNWTYWGNQANEQ